MWLFLLALIASVSLCTGFYYGVYWTQDYFRESIEEGANHEN